MDMNDLSAFIAVAREHSFTKAAGKLGVSQSALSHTIRRLETRLGLRLLTRTTRSVAPTQAGERLLATAGPRLDEVEAEVVALSELRDKPAGTIRITASDHAINTVLLPKLAAVLREHPDVKLELVIDYGLTDIVAGRYDAGVRLGEQVAKGMIAVPIGPQQRLVIVGAPAYFAKHAPPKRPQELTSHSCINLRLPSGLYAWELSKHGRDVRVRVDGQITVNGIDELITAARVGLGLAFVPEDLAEPLITGGLLRTALDDWTPPYAGFHLYYPSRRQMSPAFAVVVAALRHRR
jgi:DNA-binding transcriptional LysR family regulator